MKFAVAAAGVLLLSGGALAASFDCAKAATQVEHLICADPKLSTLDDQLATAYGQHSKQDKDLAKSERDWLSGTRNKCSTRACLIDAYSARIEALKTHAPACPVSAEALLGSWVQAGGTGFEEVNFSVFEGQRAFLSFLHHAPEVTGSWELKDCELHIQGSENSIEFDFSIEAFDHGRLSLKDESENETLVLKKFDPKK